MSAAAPRRPASSGGNNIGHRPFPRPTTAAAKSKGQSARKQAADRPAFVNDAQGFATAQGTKGKEKYIPLNRGPVKEQYKDTPGLSDGKEALLEEIMSLKTALTVEKKQNLKLKSNLRRLNVSYTKSIRDNAKLIHSSDLLTVKDLKRIALENERSDVVRALREQIVQVQEKLKQRDGHIDGIMRSANATGLLEMAAARDEYYREVKRLQKKVSELEVDRSNFSAALEDRVVTEEGEGLGGESAGIFKSVIRAQHSRIVDLKGKLEKQKQATSPRKTKEFLRQQAERVDFKGQDEARRRVEAKRRKERKEEWDVMEFLNGEV
ncbi:hypothetical protein TrVE_jg4717 [Triparma verrucosa]|uniref:Lebercilin domain-containing protein n=1 Tax=Triparma verrucosa TaxID=1606542 RepID=A0A9W7F8Z0_9STRA|nr:hypothetical protein TrVE_jg4717 [Triparma verrucosa]